MDNCGMQTNKNKRAPEQISTDAVTLVARVGVVRGEYRVSKHVKVERKGGLEQKMTMRKRVRNKVHPKAIHECVNEWASYGTTQSTWRRKGREWCGDGRHRVRRYALQWTGYSQGVKRC